MTYYSKVRGLSGPLYTGFSLSPGSLLTMPGLLLLLLLNLSFPVTSCPAVFRNQCCHVQKYR